MFWFISCSDFYTRSSHIWIEVHVISLEIFFDFEYKCMHLFSRTKCSGIWYRENRVRQHGSTTGWHKKKETVLNSFILSIDPWCHYLNLTVHITLNRIDRYVLPGNCCTKWFILDKGTPWVVPPCDRNYDLPSDEDPPLGKVLLDPAILCSSLQMNPDHFLS